MMKKIFSFVTVLMALLGTFCFMSCDKDEETTNYVKPAHMWFAGPLSLESTGYFINTTGSFGAGSVGSGNGGGHTWLQMTAVDLMPDGTVLVYDLINGEKDDVYESTEGYWTAFEHNSEWSYFVGTVVDKTGRHESPRKYHYTIGGNIPSLTVTDDKGKEWEYGILYADINEQNKFSKFKNSEGKTKFISWNPTTGPLNSDLFK